MNGSNLCRIGWIAFKNSFVFPTALWCSMFLQPTTTECTIADPEELLGWLRNTGWSKLVSDHESGRSSSGRVSRRAWRNALRSLRSSSSSSADMSLRKGMKTISVQGFWSIVPLTDIGESRTVAKLFGLVETSRNGFRVSNSKLTVESARSRYLYLSKHAWLVTHQ